MSKTKKKLKSDFAPPPAIETYKVWVESKVPYRCPVCGGNGMVDAGFYSQTSGGWPSIGGTEICKSCNGTGIIWG